MGFTAVHAHIFLKRVELDKLDIAFWKKYVKQMSRLCKKNIKGVIPHKYISDSNEDLVIPFNEDADQRINYFFGTFDDLIKDINIQALFEEGCPEDIPKCKLKKKFVRQIMNDDAIEFNGIENDPNWIYFVVGAFGIEYVGSIGGGARDGEETYRFNFALNPKCLQNCTQYRHLRLIANELKPDTLFLSKPKMLECFNKWK